MRTISISDMVFINVRSQKHLENDSEIFDLKMSFLVQKDNAKTESFETQYTIRPDHYSIIVDDWLDRKRLIILADPTYKSLAVTGTKEEIGYLQSSVCSDLRHIACISKNFADLGYTPDNLRTFMKAYNLNNKTCSKILNKKGRNTFGRYLLPISSNSHSSMSHVDWIKLTSSVMN